MVNRNGQINWDIVEGLDCKLFFRVIQWEHEDI